MEYDRIKAYSVWLLNNIVCVIYILGQYFKYIFETKISELQCDSMSG